jgi:hypothetical protein
MARVNVNLPLYRTLVAKGLSETEAERWATLATTLRLPALFDALIHAGCPPEKAHAAVEEVAAYADQRRPVTAAVGSWLARP